MVPTATADDGGAGGFFSRFLEGRSISRRNLRQRQEQGNVPSDRPILRSQSNLGRSDRRSWFCIRRRTLFVYIGVSLILLAIFSLFLEDKMTAEFLEFSKKAWMRDSELKFGMTHKFVPQRFPRRSEEGNDLDQLRSTEHYGYRKPRLALILRNMEKDAQSLLLFTVMQHMKTIGYVFEIFSVRNGKARQIWQELGQLFPLSPKGHVNWLRFEGIIVDSFEGKDAITSLMLEPFCSIPLIWIIQDDILAKRLKMYKEKGWENLVSHWRSTFSRASVIVFPNFALPMLYSTLDTGNFHVIRGSPLDVWTAEIYMKSHSKYQLYDKLGINEKDFVVLAVGNSFYDELSPDYVGTLNLMEPLLKELAGKFNTRGSFRFVFLCGNSTDGCADFLQETASRLSIPRKCLSHFGFDHDVNDILYLANIVLYASSLNVQDFPPLLIRAMAFGTPIVAPNLPIINERVVNGLHGLLLTKFTPYALRSTALSILTSDGMLTGLAKSIASSGRLLAKNLLASECITGYKNLLEDVLNFPSDVIPPKDSQLTESVWEWGLFRNELKQGCSSEQRNEKSSVVIKLEEEFADISSPVKENLVHEVPTEQDWDIIGEIERIEEYDRAEMEELEERTDIMLDSWEEVYEIARKSDRIRLENVEEEVELERASQEVCIYEIYSGSGSWPFLHHGALFRGLSLSTKALRLESDDVNAARRLPLLKDRFYQDILCEIGGMFAIANKIDTIHRKPWIGFQSWQADSREASLSEKARQVLEEAIHNNTRGEVIYFWADLEMIDYEDADSNGDDTYGDHSPFWNTCDFYNHQQCSSTFEDAFREMYGLPPSHKALPPMPDDEDLWSSLHNWLMPTPTFLEFMMFSRMFVDSIDAVSRKFGKCPLASSELERKHCYCRLLEILINVWAYHSGRKMVHINPVSGFAAEQHPLEGRKNVMWSEFFNIRLLKAMDADLAQAAYDNDRPRATWLWPSTGEVFWEGIYQREREQAYRMKMEKKRISKQKKLNKHKIQQTKHRRSHERKQKPLGG